MNYIRQEMPYVAYVRDQALADLQIFINRIRNGSGGSTFELSFQGPGGKNEMTYQTDPMMTWDETRKGLLKYIQSGVMPYLAPYIDENDIQIEIPDQREKKTSKQVDVADKWNYWIFEVRAEGGLDKESSQEEVDIELGFEADRITEEWRINATAEMNYNTERFERDEGDIIVFQRRHFLNGRAAKSLGDHWSAGTYWNLFHDTYRNTELAWNLTPAVEYSLFPYREVIRREITIAYRIGYLNNQYIEPTIYDKMSESLFNQSLVLNMRFRQPWGTVYSRLEASTFLHDLSKNSVELDSYVSVRLIKGLALQVSADVELIRDQITLAKGETSLEDLLLRQRQIATDFEMGFGVGLSYTFGSAYNSIVNTRL